MKTFRATLGLLVLAIFSHGTFANTAESIQADGGLEVKITNVHGWPIGHDPSYPADGIGTSYYLTAVCQSLGFDDFSWDYQRDWVNKARYAFYDMSSYNWKKNAGPGLIYKYIVCKVYVAQ